MLLETILNFCFHWFQLLIDHRQNKIWFHILCLVAGKVWAPLSFSNCSLLHQAIHTFIMDWTNSLRDPSLEDKCPSRVVLPLRSSFLSYEHGMLESTGGMCGTKRRCQRGCRGGRQEQGKGARLLCICLICLFFLKKRYCLLKAIFFSHLVQNRFC